MLSQDILDFALNRLNKGARIALCGEKQTVFETLLMDTDVIIVTGAISQYSKTTHVSSNFMRLDHSR